MKAKLDYAALKKKQRELRDDKFPDVMGLRVHRAISWIGCAERCEKDAEDERFIFLWIAFNAASADKEIIQSEGKSSYKERNAFFRRLVNDDKDKRVRSALLGELSKTVQETMESPFLFYEFWQYHHGFLDKWEDKFHKKNEKFKQAFHEKRIAVVLGFIFERLNVLRNQLIHGGATWKSSANREQIKNGVAILGSLIPVFIDIMMDNPANNWGKPFYPLIKEE